MSNNLVISDIQIREDAEGRFCLNDLHQASGENPKHKPANWLRNQQVIDLIELLNSEQSTTGIRVIFIKQGVGTFATKELVYAYAMWINAEFHIQVIRAYDALVTKKTFGFDFLHPINEPITLDDFNWRKQILCDAFENLEKAHVLMTITVSGAELLAGNYLAR